MVQVVCLCKCMCVLIKVLQRLTGCVPNSPSTCGSSPPAQYILISPSKAPRTKLCPPGVRQRNASPPPSPQSYSCARPCAIIDAPTSWHLYGCKNSIKPFFCITSVKFEPQHDVQVQGQSGLDWLTEVNLKGLQRNQLETWNWLRYGRFSAFYRWNRYIYKRSHWGV